MNNNNYKEKQLILQMNIKINLNHLVKKNNKQLLN